MWHHSLHRVAASVKLDTLCFPKRQQKRSPWFRFGVSTPARPEGSVVLGLKGAGMSQVWLFSAEKNSDSQLKQLKTGCSLQVRNILVFSDFVQIFHSSLCKHTVYTWTMEDLV